LQIQPYVIDENQDGIIDGVIPIGGGVDATRKYLEYIANEIDKMKINNMNMKKTTTTDTLSMPIPKFIGFDVDDTILGLRPDHTKETLYEDRRETVEVMVRLLQQGIQLCFLSDNDSKLVLKRIGDPLAFFLQKQDFIYKE